MSRLKIAQDDKALKILDGLYSDMQRRLNASPTGLCPIDVSSAFVGLCHTQTCGKCVPCRVGLGQLKNLLDDVLDGNANSSHIDLIEKTARVIKNSSDCAIGFESANMVLRAVIGFRDDFMHHIQHGRCNNGLAKPVPCVALCPANVDVPGYISLVWAGRHADAVRLIRKDNPFPGACGLICEHPCEHHCRRTMVDDAINIRGIKRYSIDHAGDVPAPACADKTGKKVAVIGSGPCGLSASYFLQLMGHQVTVFEQRDKLGGMLRYGIPSYRLPRNELDKDINVILSTGVQVKTNVSIGTDITLEQLRKDFDAVYISIGAHTDKKIGIEGEDKRGVLSAVEMLRAIGDDNLPDFKGKKVVVVGGGNVAMDVCRTSKRLGASHVQVAYRRRQEDMTALLEEIEGAIAEGVELVELMAPVKIESDADDNVTGLWVQPQIVGGYDRAGRPGVSNANAQPVKMDCDIVIVSIGQGIESQIFEKDGISTKWDMIIAESNACVDSQNFCDVFAGGDCVSGPASAILAIAGAKVAAANIDEYLGFNHTIECNIDIPVPEFKDVKQTARVNMPEADHNRVNSFDAVEYCMSDEEVAQETSRCLRCDFFGYGKFRGGRVSKW